MSATPIPLMARRRKAGASDPIGDALRADCVAYWKMEAVSGSRIDSTGNGNTLTDFSSNVSGVSGKIGNAAEFGFDESNYKYLTSTSNPHLTIDITGESFYFALWAKLNRTLMLANFGTSANVFLKGEFDGDTQDYRLSYYEPSQIFVFGNYNSNAAEIPVTIDDNAFYFIECRYNHVDSKVGLAINLSAFTEADSYSGEYPTTASPFYIGNDENNTAIWYGLVDEVGLFKTNQNIGTWLTQAKRDYLYNSGAGRSLYP